MPQFANPADLQQEILYNIYSYKPGKKSGVLQKHARFFMKP